MKQLIKLDGSQKKKLYIISYIALAIGIYFLRSYLMLIILSAIMSVLFGPVYSWYLKKGKSPSKSSVYTLTISIFAIIIPITIIISLTVAQINSIVSSLSTDSYSVNLTDVANQFVDWVNSTLARFGQEQSFSIEKLNNYLIDAAQVFAQQLVTALVDSFSGIFNMITAAIIYIYVFLSMLVNRDKILSTIKKFNPLGDEISDIYFERVSAMTKATVRGQFIIAFMQGGWSALILALVGNEQFFFFFLVLLTFMSLIPMGAGIITIPLGAIMILTGNISEGIIVIANHLIIVTNIDNVMRPKLVPKNSRLDPALMILAVFSGMALWGFIGIVLGPIVMILILTTVQIFNEVFFEEESIDRSKPEKKVSRFSKFKNSTSRISKSK